MNIQHTEDKKEGAFFSEDGAQRSGELLYRVSGPGRITVYHTEINEKLRGRGAGSELVAAAVSYARDNNLKIVPVCPFARKVIEKTPEFQDVLAAEIPATR